MTQMFEFNSCAKSIERSTTGRVTRLVSKMRTGDMTNRENVMPESGCKH